MHYINLNKLLKKPLYVQLADSIENAYNNKLLKNGDLLPTEKEICESFDVSTSVVKYAYKNLIDKGIVRRQVGRGTFIWDETVNVLDTADAGNLFLDYTRFKRQVIYIEDTSNTLNTHRPMGMIRVLYELITRRNKPIALRKLYIQASKTDLFLEEGWNTDQRLRFKSQAFSTIQSYMRVVNLQAKEARILSLDANTASFTQRVDFYENAELVGVLESYYPGEHFVWRQSFEALQLRQTAEA